MIGGFKRADFEAPPRSFSSAHLAPKAHRIALVNCHAPPRTPGLVCVTRRNAPTRLVPVSVQARVCLIGHPAPDHAIGSPCAASSLAGQTPSLLSAATTRARYRWTSTCSRASTSPRARDRRPPIRHGTTPPPLDPKEKIRSQWNPRVADRWPSRLRARIAFGSDSEGRSRESYIMTLKRKVIES